MIGTDVSKLVYFVWKQNALRSSQAAADGFVSGNRVDSLRLAQKERDKALLDLVDWVEQKARECIKSCG